MLEQQTISNVAEAAQIWGPIGTGLFVLVVFIGYQMYSHSTMKRRAYNPISDITKELSDKTNFEWVEKQLDKYQLKEVADNTSKSILKRLDNIERLILDWMNRESKTS